MALVGTTGVGKTTLASLVNRFYDPQAGSIQVDGIDIRDVTLSSLRDNISMVLQDTFLFDAAFRFSCMSSSSSSTSYTRLRPAAARPPISTKLEKDFTG